MDTPGVRPAKGLGKERMARGVRVLIKISEGGLATQASTMEEAVR